MNYEELRKALQLVKDACEGYSKCQDCPLGNFADDCMIREEDPSDWNIADKQVIRLLKQKGCNT